MRFEHDDHIELPTVRSATPHRRPVLNAHATGEIHVDQT
jgi:hypothetical protein